MKIIINYIFHLDDWFSQVYDVDKDVFRDNQLKPVKNAIVIPQTKSGQPGPVAMEIRGLVPTSIGDFTWDHSLGNEPMKIDVTCKCDFVKFRTVY